MCLALRPNVDQPYRFVLKRGRRRSFARELVMAVPQDSSLFPQIVGYISLVEGKATIVGQASEKELVKKG